MPLPPKPLKVHVNKYSGVVPSKVQRVVEGSALPKHGRKLSAYQKKVLQRIIEERRTEKEER